VGTVALGANVTTFRIAGRQKYDHEAINFNYPSKKDVEMPPPDGATIMISSVPVVIQNQVGRNIFMVNIPNDKGGYSSVILQKSGNRFIGLPGEFLPDFS
jgi:hypothetical protein